jgi:MFS family permease
VNDSHTSSSNLAIQNYNPNPAIEFKITLSCIQKTKTLIDILTTFILSCIFLWLFFEDHRGFQKFLCNRNAATDFKKIGNILDYATNVLCGLFLLLLVIVIVLKIKDKKSIALRKFIKENPALKKETYKCLSLKFISFLFINFLVDALGLHLVSELDQYLLSTQHNRSFATLFSSALLFIFISSALIGIHLHRAKKSTEKKFKRLNIGLASAFLAQCFGATTLYLSINNLGPISNTFLLTALSAGFLGAITAAILFFIDFYCIKNDPTLSIESNSSIVSTEVREEKSKTRSMILTDDVLENKKEIDIKNNNGENNAITLDQSVSSLQHTL